MVYNGKPLLTNGWFGGFSPYFWKHPYAYLFKSYLLDRWISPVDPELQRNVKSSPGCVSSVILRMVSLRVAGSKGSATGPRGSIKLRVYIGLRENVAPTVGDFLEFREGGWFSDPTQTGSSPKVPRRSSYQGVGGIDWRDDAPKWSRGFPRKTGCPTRCSFSELKKAGGVNIGPQYVPINYRWPPGCLGLKIRRLTFLKNAKHAKKTNKLSHGQDIKACVSYSYSLIILL